MSQAKKTLTEEEFKNLVNELNQNKKNLFQMKERGRLVLGQFINSEICNFNSMEKSVEVFPLTYSIDYFGDFHGKVYLNLKQEIAIYLGALLFNDTITSLNEDIDSAMKEVLNIFSGHLVTFFHEHGYSLDIGVPELCDHNFTKTKTKVKILFRFSCKDQILQFLVDIR